MYIINKLENYYCSERVIMNEPISLIKKKCRDTLVKGIQTVQKLQFDVITENHMKKIHYYRIVSNFLKKHFILNFY